MKITVLGSGNAFCSAGRGHTSFLVESGTGESVLLDAGATAPRALATLRASLETLEAVALTHLHGDHTFGFPFVVLQLSELLRRTRPLTVIGPPGTQRRCGELMRLAYARFEPRFPIEYVEDARAPQTLARLEFDPRPVTHAAGSTGYRVTEPARGTVVFSGDASFDDRLVELVAGADLGVIELTLLCQPDPPLPHVSVAELSARRAELDVPELLLVHLDDEVAEAARRLGLGTPARDGDVIEL